MRPPSRKSALARRRWRPVHRGAALLIFMVLLVMGAMTYLVNQFTPEAVAARRAQQTSAALVQARDALLGYALQYREQKAAQSPPVLDAMSGHLPLPDFGESVNLNANLLHQTCTSEGCAKINPAGLSATDVVVGRFPWKTVGTGPLRDSHQECLWYAVSTSHRAVNSTAPQMHWDTLAIPDIVIGSGQADLSSVNTHERPLAVIFSPGPAFDGERSQTTDAPICGGNYDPAHYLNPALNNAQQALPITSRTLFGAIRKHAYFRNDIKEMLKRMANCWSHNLTTLSPVAIAGYTVPSDKVAGRIPDAPTTCNEILESAYGNDRDPQGYFDAYREMIFIARPEPSSGSFTVNGDSTCKGVLIFSGPRGAGQERSTTTDQLTLSNYLEGNNLTSFTGAGTLFSGDSVLASAPPQASGTDIVLCIPPTTAGPVLVGSPLLPDKFGQLVAYDATTRTLTLGKAGSTTNDGAPEAALFGCAWMDDNLALGNGGRLYFSVQFKKVGTNVGSNGFVFTLADAGTNSTTACGAVGSHLGYSGDNGSTPKITFPKIGIEFDQSRNSGFSQNLTNPGRNDPCGTTTAGCAGLGYNSHASIVYWGNGQSNVADQVTLADNDDNVHGFPATPPETHPAPTNPTYPSPGFAFLDMRGKTSLAGDSSLFHVRIELQPTRSVTPTAEDSHTQLQTRVWILADSSTVTNQIAALRNTIRPMSTLYPSLNPTLQDTATLYDVAEIGSSCSADSPCPNGQSCGTDSRCYRPALKTLQSGFTGSQRTTDQDVRISDYTDTWLP